MPRWLAATRTRAITLEARPSNSIVERPVSSLAVRGIETTTRATDELEEEPTLHAAEDKGEDQDGGGQPAQVPTIGSEQANKKNSEPNIERDPHSTLS